MSPPQVPAAQFRSIARPEVPGTGQALNFRAMPKTPLSPIEHVDIALGDRSYRIAIGGGLLDAADSFADLPVASTALIVSNTTVAPLYADGVCAAFLA